ncbi:MAG: hypothetical protein MI919_24455, partial [Holophagales bacterium]|nr:hypothetical protein [Holophagales bacterium]
TLALSGLLLLAAWGFDSAGLAESARDSWTEATRTSSTDLQPLSMGLLGLTKDVGGQLTPRRSDGTWKLGTVGPIRRSPLLFVLVGLLAALAVATADRHRWRGGPWLDPTRLLCWCWLLGGLVLVGLQEYQPDRRYLFLMLPVAILVADALMGPRGPSARYARSHAPPSEGLGVLLGGESPRRRRWTAALAFGLWIGLIARAPLAEWVEVAAAGISVGEHPGLTPRLAGALAWALTAGAVAALAAAFLPRVVSAFEQRIGTGDRRRRVVIALLLLLAAIQIVPFVQYLANPIYSVRDAARLLDAWSRDWPVDRRVMVGNHADTLALESRLLAVVIRPWRDSGFFMNEDGWSRFDPWVVQGREPPIPGFRRAGTLELGVGRIDAPHFRLAIYTREGIPPLPASAEPEGPDP